MEADLPVIASNCSGNIDIVRDGMDGRLFPVGDVLKLAALMEELVCDPNTGKRLGEEAKTVAERFHPDLFFTSGISSFVRQQGRLSNPHGKVLTYRVDPYSPATQGSGGFFLVTQSRTARSYAILLGYNGDKLGSYFGSASLRLRSRSSRPDLPRS
jgi:hypothetical protein